MGALHVVCHPIDRGRSGVKTTQDQIALRKRFAVTRDRTRDLQIFSLTLSQLSYCGY